MTDSKQKLNAVFLSALMVMSVFAATIALSGAAAASNRGAGNTYSTGPTDSYTGTHADSTGEVGDGAVVFQGEEDLAPNGNFGSTDIGNLQKVSGDSSGILLENPIPKDHPTGTYTDNGDSNGQGVTLQTPRVTDIEVQNNGGGDVTGSTLQVSSQSAYVGVDYNYEEAEDIEITVEDEDGLEVTNELVNGPTELNTNTGAGSPPSGFNVGFTLDTQAVDEGQYTITVDGVEDLDFGDATKTVTVNISTDQKASLNLNNDEVTQGEDLTYTVDDSPEGNYHAVVIESDEFRSGITVDQAADIFRNAGDVTETGIVDGSGVVTDSGTNGLNDEIASASDAAYAYAIVEIDGGTGVGSIETQYLDDSSIDADLYQASSETTEDYASGGSHGTNVDLIDATTFSGPIDVDDDPSFDVVEGEVSIDSPDGTYVTGSDVDVSGTANEGVDNVAIYVRDNSEYKLVGIDGSPTVSVEGDDTFSEEDIDISTSAGPGNNILDLPGTYRIGVIDAQDADVASGDKNSLSGNNNIDKKLTTSDFNSGVSSSDPLRVEDTALNGTFTTYNGQIATEDNRINVDGQAPGKNNVVIAFVDSRGTVAAQEVSVDNDDTFEKEDISLENDAGTKLSEGTVTAHILSSGRDDVFGEDGTVNLGTIKGYTGTADQVRSKILDNTVGDTGSDDLIVTEQFRLNDGLTTIESVSSPVEANGTVAIQGTTNRRPDDNSISVELLNEEHESITIESAGEWGTDGQWSATLDLSDTDVDPGNYTVESDDGDNTDRASVQVVEELSTETETPEQTEQQTEQQTEEPTEEPTDEPTEQPTETPTGDSGPGFTVVAALGALIAAALLAVRRNN